MVQSSKQRENIALLTAAIVALAALLCWRFAGQPTILVGVLRWAALAALVLYGCLRRTLSAWIFIAMLLGAAIGHDFPNAATNLRVLALIFLRLIKTIIAPLIFGTLVVGIAGHSNLRQVGRLGLRSIIYFEIVTTIAIFLGLAAINISKAGVGVQLPPSTTAESVPVTKLSAQDTILHIFPENIAKAVADGAVLEVVVFSLIFAVALAMIGEQKRRPMLAFCESLSEVMFKFTNIVMYMAPLGVGAAVAYTVGHTGLGILASLLKLLLTLYVALAVFVLGVLLPVALIFRVPLRRFLKAVAEPVTIAFGTASSEAALPRAMEAMEAIGVPRQIVAFVIPTGYSFNLDGSSLYLSVAAIFVAQVSGIHLSLGQQLLIMLTLMVTSKGVAGVSRAALVILLATASSTGLPTEPVFLLLGVDQLLDMGRTAVNVLGNCLASVVMAKCEGEFGVETPSASVKEAVLQ
ncbi:MAG TPA: cation:dicarboxylase symporter family transporter [Candidatus Limnocylindrales bacterium]|nr:cation:dicarboxylase symporter family transporter [Candidatus Limnocylindrales bacterium]